jgi:hypothetical protein
MGSRVGPIHAWQRLNGFHPHKISGWNMTVEEHGPLKLVD